MTTSEPTPVPVVKDDPSKPWKALISGIAAAVLTALTTYFTGTNDISWNGVIIAVVNGLVAFGLTFVVRNPKAPTQ